MQKSKQKSPGHLHSVKLSVEGKKKFCNCKLWIKVMCWWLLKESGETMMKCFIRPLVLVVCRGFEKMLLSLWLF